MLTKHGIYQVKVISQACAFKYFVDHLYSSKVSFGSLISISLFSFAFSNIEKNVF